MIEAEALNEDSKDAGGGAGDNDSITLAVCAGILVGTLLVVKIFA